MLKLTAEQERQRRYFSVERITKSGMDRFRAVNVVAAVTRKIIDEAEEKGDNTPLISEAMNIAIDKLFPWDETNWADDDKR